MPVYRVPYRARKSFRCDWARRAWRGSLPGARFGVPIRVLFGMLFGALFGALFESSGAIAQEQTGTPERRCGEVIAIETHAGTTTRYAFVAPPSTPAPAEPITLLLLAGGSGRVDLDALGCARALKGNSLARSIPLFSAQGFGTALVDAPSDHDGDDGLAGFRSMPAHAQDLGRVIADLRTRTKGAVWLVGTSRGSLSAVNAAARLSGPAAADGVVLTSALMSGDNSARKRWVAHSVFDLPLEDIKQPLLVVGHSADRCIRSPPTLMGRIVARTQGVREQVITVTGGPGLDGPIDTSACEGRSAHGFIGQEAELVAGIARFVRGGRY
jgi:hypothetical protein